LQPPTPRTRPRPAFRYAILRYFYVAGSDPAGEIVENHAPETHLIPLAI